jgi:Uma2 family endonuclease
MVMNVVLPNRLTVDEFLAWAVRQEQGKYELFDGVVVMQQAQQWEHAKVKLEIVLVLREAIKRAGLNYYAAPDGMTVRITKRTAFEPDALVAPLPEPDRKSLEVSNPTIVVEVLSPSTARADATKKLRGYFQVPSVQHYLILDPEGFTVTHHKRGPGDALETRVVGEGAVHLDPPGLVIEVRDIFGSTAPDATG